MQLLDFSVFIKPFTFNVPFTKLSNDLIIFTKNLKHLTIMKKLLLYCFLILGMSLTAQENLTYQKPSKEILELAEAPLAPSIRMDTKGENIVFLNRSNYKTIEELSEEELRLGGLRINPVTNIGSRTRYYTGIAIKNGKKGSIKNVTGLPDVVRLANFTWSPDEKLMAFTNTVSKGVELWILDIATGKASKISAVNLNANADDAFTWFKDSKALLVKTIPSTRQPLINTKEAVPIGPTISTSEAGVEAQNRTYQDLLKNKNDEFNFEQLVLADLYKIDLNLPWINTTLP